jgi:GntR family transcriptional regulator
MKLNIVVSNTSAVPIYEQITQQIKNCIMSGDLKEKEPLPSIRKLANELSISVITTKRAYEELEREGYILSGPGKGFFVSAQNIDFLREARIKIVEEKLLDAIKAGKMINLTQNEMCEMLQLLAEEDAS